MFHALESDLANDNMKAFAVSFHDSMLADVMQLNMLDVPIRALVY